MVRNVIGIVFLVLSGLYIGNFCLFSFMSYPEDERVKWIMLSTFAIIVLVFHSIGLLFYKGKNWKVSTGIGLLCGAVIGVFGVAIIFAIRHSSLVQISSDAQMLDRFLNGYQFGLLTTIVLLGVGSGLLWQGRKVQGDE